jgi:hypothetical protein
VTSVFGFIIEHDVVGMKPIHTKRVDCIDGNKDLFLMTFRNDGIYLYQSSESATYKYENSQGPSNVFKYKNMKNIEYEKKDNNKYTFYINPKASSGVSIC